jgi:PKD repeat protein
MKANHVLFIIALLFAVGCTDHYNSNRDSEVKPEASFSFRGNTSATLKMATNDTCTLFNTSVNADSSTWTLGDGRTLKTRQIVLSYPKSGTYTVKLKVRKFDGQTAEISKTVVVVDRILKKIIIDKVQWDTTIVSQGWPTTNKVDIYFQIQLYTDNTMKPKGIYPNCPVLYKSPVIKNIVSNYVPPTYAPIEITLTDKFVLEKSLLSKATGASGLNNLYILSVMGVDAAGKTYCLVNNVWYNLDLDLNDDWTGNKFSATANFLTSFKLICAYE